MSLINDTISFITGYYRLAKSELGELDNHIIEQVIYRSEICSDCLKQKQCKDCYCDLPARFFVDKKNQKCPFPKLMNEEDWIKFKNEHKIIIKS